MKHLKLFISALLICCFCQAQTVEADIPLVKEACFNYIDAFYKADTTLAHTSVHPLLQKRGFSYDKAKASYSKQLEMPFQSLIRLATVWNKDGSKANAQSPRTVQIFEVTDKTASAKVSAVWGIDYLHLVKENGRWYVMNVLWQSEPLAVGRP